MIDEFLKKVYIKIKELFTQTENPLYDSFYKDEQKGFEEFKKHALGDETMDWVFNDPLLTDDQVDPTAVKIISKINRMYYMSKQ